MIQWPKRALGAIRKLFEPLQDIDVYIEDINDEVFYTNLFKRICENNVRIARVFSLGGRSKVIEAAISHDHCSRKALFLVDGDFEWVLGRPHLSVRGLFRLNAYCIENLLITEDAVVKILMEDAILSAEDAARRVSFSLWVQTVEEHLVGLFAAFATAHLYSPAVSTVSRGIGCICSQRQGNYQKIDYNKVETIRLSAIASAVSCQGQDDALAVYEEILKKAKSLPRPMDIVSGKDFLLPLICFLFQSNGIRLKKNVIRHRLALACDISLFSDLLFKAKAVAAEIN